MTRLLEMRRCPAYGPRPGRNGPQFRQKDAMTTQPASVQSRSPAALGIGLMVLGIFLFCCNDALGKWLPETYSVWQMLLIRSVAAMILLTPLIWREGRAAFISAPHPALQILRVTLSVAESILFFW